VIGTLLGRRNTNSDGKLNVEVTNCFAVPHAEHGDEVAIGKDFNRQMLALHNRANRNEVVVGWYATALPPGSEGKDGGSSNSNEEETEGEYKCIADTSSLIHEFYAGECGGPSSGGGDGDPIHLVLDTSLKYDTIAIKAYRSTPIAIKGEPFANMFHEIRVRIKSAESERICVDKMIKGLSGGGKQVDHAEALLHHEDVLGNKEPGKEDAMGLQMSMEKLLQLLESASTYVDQIVDGTVKIPTDDRVGRKLYDAISSVPRIRNEIFDGMFHDSLQDLLMVSYLSNLTKTQLVIAEKLNETLTLA